METIETNMQTERNWEWQKKKAGACDELCILLVKCQPPWNSKVGRKNMWFR